MNNTEIEDVDGIAIVGMAGRFPRARNIDEFWRNLRNGVEAISFFTEEELRSAGVDSALLSDPSYVRANATLEDIELFDASFFEKPRSWIRSNASSWSAHGKHWRMPGTVRIPTRDASAFTPDTG
jgi:hypothetical protein